ncbi:Dihydrolipoyllysine-residue acetyltransferase component 5 of pyruvate dehydrogenase complex protein [Thalictrum thalictroides]|uniref:Dihydrolipoyllysine-residue acetyltransferase component 5 of pyruvate dehydrogenase complex protein n=1 Tax=Thalictrum thalictroides TaxID=46969 RepID=A0A7J6X082_THATH|nr:Dihydrolipoyllysine-residue acetyltransferase component 5 of pyruvate dehydrogenase complex protein [Thalictrum thalictroides]
MANLLHIGSSAFACSTTKLFLRRGNYNFSLSPIPSRRFIVEATTYSVGYTITTDALDCLYRKATALALVKHPVVNSSCRDGNSFTYNNSINIAVDVAIDGGMITPVLQDADKVLSNLGMLGVDRFDAILPLGTGAIMTVGASQPSLVATKDGGIGLKNQMQVNVTADHRVIYGADLASFLQTLANIIEDPKDLTL